MSKNIEVSGTARFIHELKGGRNKEVLVEYDSLHYVVPAGWVVQGMDFEEAKKLNGDAI